MKVSMMSMCVLLVHLCAAVQAASVYRCVGEDGVPRFQQHACPGDGEPVPLSVPAAAWDALRPGERRLLEQYRRAERAPRSTTPIQKSVSERSCSKKQRSLERLSERLRRGYKASQWQSLRDRQHDLRAYLRRYCD